MELKTGRLLRLVFNVLCVLYAGNLLLTGDARTRRFIFFTLAILGSIVGISLWAESHPEHPVARLLITSRGPSAFTFLRFGAVMLALLMMLLYVLASSRNAATQTTLVWLLPFVMFPAAMGVLGGLYLLVRTFTRRP